SKIEPSIKAASATTTNTTNAIRAADISLPGPNLNLSSRFKQRRPQLGSRGRHAIGELGTHAGGSEDTANFSTLINAGAIEAENVLHADAVLVHACNLGHRSHLAGAVGEARDLHYGMHRGRDLVTHRTLRNIEVRHRDHI